MSILSKSTHLYNTEVSFVNIRPGMKLLVRSKEWWERNANNISGIKGVVTDGYTFVGDMSRLCGSVVTVDAVRDAWGNQLCAADFGDGTKTPERPHIAIIEEDGNPNPFYWTPGMFECILS